MKNGYSVEVFSTGFPYSFMPWDAERAINMADTMLKYGLSMDEIEQEICRSFEDVSEVWLDDSDGVITITIAHGI